MKMYGRAATLVVKVLIFAAFLSKKVTVSPSPQISNRKFVRAHLKTNNKTICASKFMRTIGNAVLIGAVLS